MIGRTLESKPQSCVSAPLLYEINTRCWLRELSDKSHKPVTLANVPDLELSAWRDLGFTHIWLMGVWSSGPLARAQALASPSLREAFSRALPDCKDEDVGGSPYAIGVYSVPEELGGDAGLQSFRQRLRELGLKLVLDFVPNHVGLDHPWLRQRPELFVQSSGQQTGTYRQETAAGSRWLAHGKDPYWPAWTDTVQLDYRQPATRAAMTGLLRSVADHCDGVRCDMAMLLLNDVFAKTWEHFPPAGEQPPAPATEFWSAAISLVKQSHPDFIFMAEVYWGLEPRLQELGFDYTYDKALYDKLLARDGAAVQTHLLGLSPRQLAAGAHFLENHDEPRLAPSLPPAEQQPAALVILGLPGLRFLHEGQLTGARLKLPVQLLRRALEPQQPEVKAIYDQLLPALQASAVARGSGKVLAPRAAWEGNPTHRNFALVLWQAQPPEFDLVVVNLAPHRSQCYAPLEQEPIAVFRRDWLMTDRLGTESFVRPGPDLQRHGLFLDLPPHGAQLFHFAPQ
jgi:hypothetical protein